MKICHLFQLEPELAFQKSKTTLEYVKSYDETQYGHSLHDWTGGGRSLYRCSECGAYVLKQLTEIDAFDDQEEEYVTYWPVADEADAEQLNMMYAGDLSGHLKRIHIQEHYGPSGRKYGCFDKDAMS